MLPGVDSFTQMLSLPKEEVLRLITTLHSSDDPNSKTLAESLNRALSEGVYDMTVGQKHLKLLVDALRQRGESDEQIDNIVGEIIEASVYESSRYLKEKVFTPEISNKWDSLQATAPNFLQNLLVLDYLCSELAKESLDDIYERYLSLAVENVIKIINRTDLLKENINLLPEESLAEVERYFEAGEFERAIALIYQQTQHGI